jgi:hypothetical protein
MRKELLNRTPPHPAAAEDAWLDIEGIALAQISSEAPDHPLEGALLPGRAEGWRAAGPGAQTLRLVFDSPRRLRRIVLRFDEAATPRTQEFVLRWLPHAEQSWRDIVRQQFNFSPPHTTVEVEDYGLKLDDVAALELVVVPEIGGGSACATLSQLRLA